MIGNKKVDISQNILPQKSTIIAESLEKKRLKWRIFRSFSEAAPVSIFQFPKTLKAIKKRSEAVFGYPILQNRISDLG